MINERFWILFVLILVCFAAVHKGASNFSFEYRGIMINCDSPKNLLYGGLDKNYDCDDIAGVGDQITLIINPVAQTVLLWPDSFLTNCKVADKENFDCKDTSTVDQTITTDDYGMVSGKLFNSFEIGPKFGLPVSGLYYSSLFGLPYYLLKLGILSAPNAVAFSKSFLNDL